MVSATLWGILLTTTTPSMIRSGGKSSTVTPASSVTYVSQSSLERAALLTCIADCCRETSRSSSSSSLGFHRSSSEHDPLCARARKLSQPVRSASIPFASHVLIPMEGSSPLPSRPPSTSTSHLSGTPSTPCNNLALPSTTRRSRLRRSSRRSSGRSFAARSSSATSARRSAKSTRSSARSAPRATKPMKSASMHTSTSRPSLAPTVVHSRRASVVPPSGCRSTVQTQVGMAARVT